MSDIIFTWKLPDYLIIIFTWLAHLVLKITYEMDTIIVLIL